MHCIDFGKNISTLRSKIVRDRDKISISFTLHHHHQWPLWRFPETPPVSWCGIRLAWQIKLEGCFFLNLILTHYNFPVLLFWCDLIGRPHFTVCGSSSHERNDAGAGLCSALILLAPGPASVPGTGGRRASVGVLSLASKEGELVVVKLVLYCHLHDVLDHRGPPGHLICVLTGPLLAAHLPNLSAVTLQNEENKYFNSLLADLDLKK